ncbi:MAG: hypothetical protein MI810_21095 [Flavobacteriales bacterium]|nr:hypothetical protein [Flavobacteriales bacterium]
MRYFLILCVFCSLTVSAQEEWDDLSGKEKAFFYRVSRKTDILKNSVFHLFEFTDSIPYINDTLPNYKYIEKEIINDPSTLVLHRDQMARKPNGLVCDLAVQYAIWELNQVIQYRNSNDEKDQWIKEQLKVFEKYVIENAPQSAIRTLSGGEYALRKSTSSYYTPSLSAWDKLAAIKNSGYTQLDQMLCLNAISKGMEKYIHLRSKEVFELLGGNEGEYQNYLSAAGDGNDFSSLEDTYKKNPLTRALPNEIGAFNFEIFEKIDKKTEKKSLEIKDVKQYQYRMDTEQKTVLHFDVYAYHPERQTTISIQKGGSAYILYGNNDNRLLSPDSTFGEGTTYWRLMWQLEHIHIADLNEKLYGKRGYKYWIEEYEKKIQATLLQIQKTEYKINELRHKPQKKPKIKKKKWRKVDLTTSDQHGKGHPTDNLTKTQKKLNIQQNYLIQLNSLLMTQKQMLAQLKKEYEEAYFILQSYRTKLDMMQKTLGLLVMDYEVEGDLYTFSDGATFNKRTQDFTFPADGHASTFQLNHICFGEKVFSTKIDENFVHINRTIDGVDEKYVLQRIQRDKEKSNKMSVSDSIQTMEILMALLDDNTGINLTPYAGGIKVESQGEFSRNENLSAIPYEQEKYTNEGVVKYRTTYDANLNLSVEVWEDQMIPVAFSNYQKQYVKFKSKNPTLNEIDFWTGIRAMELSRKWLEDLKELVPLWIKTAEDQATILKKLKKVKLKKVQFKNGAVQYKVPKYIYPAG